MPPSALPTDRPTTVQQDAAWCDTPKYKPNDPDELVDGWGPGEVHRLVMEDAGGDGWQGADIVVIRPSSVPGNTVPEYVIKTTLDDGGGGFEYLCLESTKCYTVKVGSSDDPEIGDPEILWEIRPTVPGTPDGTETAVAKGKAPYECQFSLPIWNDDRTDVKYVCNTTCTGREL